MQSNNKQIGTLPGDHNKPGGPATERGKHANRKTKKEKNRMARPAGYAALRLLSLPGQGSRNRESIQWRKN